MDGGSIKVTKVNRNHFGILELLWFPLVIFLLHGLDSCSCRDHHPLVISSVAGFQPPTRTTMAVDKYLENEHMNEIIRKLIRPPMNLNTRTQAWPLKFPVGCGTVI